MGPFNQRLFVTSIFVGVDAFEMVELLLRNGFVPRICSPSHHLYNLDFFL